MGRDNNSYDTSWQLGVAEFRNLLPWIPRPHTLLPGLLGADLGVQGEGPSSSP